MIGFFASNRSGFARFSTSAGITLGSCLAIVVSYTAWKSIPWAILHGILSWGYVVYYAIRYHGN